MSIPKIKNRPSQGVCQGGTQPAQLPGPVNHLQPVQYAHVQKRPYTQSSTFRYMSL